MSTNLEGNIKAFILADCVCVLLLLLLSVFSAPTVFYSYSFTSVDSDEEEQLNYLSLRIMYRSHAPVFHSKVHPYPGQDTEQTSPERKPADE